jgi:hypothetical protein
MACWRWSATVFLVAELSLPASATGPEVLGKLSERYESGGRGPTTVSSGKGDAGGVSYGTYQLASKLGRADEFVRKYYPADFRGLKAGTPAFTARWKEVVGRDRKAFRATEHSFIKETHYDVLARRLQKNLGLVIGTRSRALQDVIWSTAVQHGPNTAVVDIALRPLLQKEPIGRLSDEQIIRAIYAERGRPDGKGGLVHFHRNSLAVQRAVARRFQNELRDALAALNKEAAGKD